MSDSTKRTFALEGAPLLASGLHAQLVARRRPTFEHDLKNVLHGLLSGTELLSKSLATHSPRITPGECLKLLQQQLARTEGTLHRMLDELAPAPAQAAPIRLAEILHECLHGLRHELQRFELTCSLDEALQVHAHPTLLKDVLIYVLMCTMDSLRPGAALALTVRPRDDRATVELRYPSGGSSRVLQELARIRELLSIDGARIDLEGDGETANIKISVPLVDEPAKNASARLLIVDASRDAADSLAMLAQLEGFEAQAAYDLDSALQLAQAQAPSAILVDADGSIDCAALIARARELDRRPKIVAMSHSERSCNSDLDAQLRKPLDPQELRRLLSE